MPHIAPGTEVPPPAGADSVQAEGEPPLSLTIDVVHEAGDWGSVGGAEELVRAAASAAAHALRISNAEVCVALSDDAQVAELNASYRGKPSPTNVLSFPAVPMLPVDGDPRFLGDVILALETLKREAVDLGVPLAHHLQHLVVHGVLHLLGYDHQTEEEAQEMESLEVRILAGLAINDPYAASGDPVDGGAPDNEHHKP